MREGYGTWVVIALLWCLPINVIAQDTLQQIRFDVERFDVIGDNPIGERANAVLAPYIGEQYGLEGLSAARDALEQAIIHDGYYFHRVSLPPQDLLEGVVLLQVSSFVIGDISVQGNKFFDDENILNSVPMLQIGETPNTQLLSRSLTIANKHISKSTVLRFEEGTAPDSIDAVLSVVDRDPQVFFVSLDNTGPEDGAVWRTTFGYQNGNLFNLDHAVTTTLTTAPEDTGSTLQFGINYNIPLYSYGANLDLLFSDSTSAGETGGGDEAGQSIAPGTGGGQALEITGEGTVIGFIFSRPLLTDSSFNHEWAVGLQYKNFDNKSEFGSEELEDISPNVISVPLELGYTFNRRTPGSSFFGSARLVQEVGDDDSEYNRDRLGAEAGWTALRYNLSYDLIFAEDYLFSARFSGQQTSALLISGEQFGIGGDNTLRGFQERSVTGDSGYVLNLEIWFPPVYGDMRFLVFTDLGHTQYNEGDGEGEDGQEFDPASTGFGMFWAWKESLSVSLNYGYILEGGGLDTEENQKGDSKLHVAAVYRF